MTCNILVVEDEFLVAAEMELVITDLGFNPIGVAADRRSALLLASQADIALVDLNLLDGPTGDRIGRELAETHGVTVLFTTSNPAQLGDGVPGTLGVLPKPLTDRELRAAIAYAVARHEASEATPPPRMQLFTDALPLHAAP